MGKNNGFKGFVRKAGKQITSAVGVLHDPLQVSGNHMKIPKNADLITFLSKYQEDGTNYLTKQVAGYNNNESFLSFYFGKAMEVTKQLKESTSIKTVDKCRIEAFLTISDHLRNQKKQEHKDKVEWFLDEVNLRKNLSGKNYDSAKELLKKICNNSKKIDGGFVITLKEFELKEGILTDNKNNSVSLFLSHKEKETLQPASENLLKIIELEKQQAELKEKAEEATKSNNFSDVVAYGKQLQEIQKKLEAIKTPSQNKTEEAIAPAVVQEDESKESPPQNQTEQKNPEAPPPYQENEDKTDLAGNHAQVDE